MTSTKQSKTGEKAAIEFLEAILEKNNGEMPVHYMKRHLTKLPQPIENILGSSRKQLDQFLNNHTKFFVVKYGIVYLAKAKSTGNYGRVLTMVRGQVISHHSLLLEGDARHVIIPGNLITHKNIEIGATVICNVNKSVNGTLVSSDMRVVEASETPDTLETEPKICKGNKKKKRNRNRKKKEKKDVANFPIQENTNSNFNSRSIENGVGSVIKFSHEIGKLQFGDDFLESHVSFHIDDYYEAGQKVLNLEWCLKIGDKVKFDAILDDFETKWKALVVWKGLKPQVVTVIDKKRKLEDYLEKNNPLAALNIVNYIPIVTIDGQSENSSKQKPSVNIEKENNNQPMLKVAKTSVVNIISNENSFKETGTKPKRNRESNNTLIKETGRKPKPKTKKESNNTPINITTWKPLEAKSKTNKESNNALINITTWKPLETKPKTNKESNNALINITTWKPLENNVCKSIVVNTHEPSKVIQDAQCIFKEKIEVSVNNENKDKRKVMKRRANTTINKDNFFNENSFKETGTKPKTNRESNNTVINITTLKQLENNVCKSIVVNTHEPSKVIQDAQCISKEKIEISVNNENRNKGKVMKRRASTTINKDNFLIENSFTETGAKSAGVSTYKPVEVKSNEPIKDSSNYSYSEPVRKVNERLIYWKEEKSESTLISCRKDTVINPEINYFGTEERNCSNDNVYKPIKSADKIKQENPNCIKVSRNESITNDLTYRQIEDRKFVFPSKIDDDDDSICCNSKCIIL